MNHLMVQMSNKCSSEVSTKVFYIPNSKVNNFIYGDGVTQEQYQQGIDRKLEQGFTSVECPFATPFPGDTNCMHCNDGEYFDLSARRCLACSNGLTFNPLKRQCTSTPFNTAGNVNNYMGVLPAIIPGRNACSDQTPYFDGSKCVACALPSFFDFGDNRCKTCP